VTVCQAGQHWDGRVAYPFFDFSATTAETMLRNLTCFQETLRNRKLLAAINWGALSAVVVWGIDSVVVKSLLGVFDPAGFQCLRSLVGGAMFLTVVSLLRPGLRRSLRLAFFPLLGLGLLMGAQTLTFVVSLDMTYACEGALVFSTAPVWTGLIATVAGLETMGRRNWAGFCIALAGVAMVVLGAEQSPSSAAPARIGGDLLMLSSAAVYGLYMVFSRPVIQKHGTLVVTAVALVLSNVVLIPAGWGKLVASPWDQVTTLHWAFVAYSIVLAMGYGMIMWYRSVKRRGASRTVVYQYLMPIVALGAAVAFLRERPTGWQLAGIAVTLAGVYFASQRSDSLQPGPVAQE